MSAGGNSGPAGCDIDGWAFEFGVSSMALSVDARRIVCTPSPGTGRFVGVVNSISGEFCVFMFVFIPCCIIGIIICIIWAIVFG